MTKQWESDRTDYPLTAQTIMFNNRIIQMFGNNKIINNGKCTIGSVIFSFNCTHSLSSTDSTI